MEQSNLEKIIKSSPIAITLGGCLISGTIKGVINGIGKDINSYYLYCLLANMAGSSSSSLMTKTNFGRENPPSNRTLLREIIAGTACGIASGTIVYGMGYCLGYCATRLIDSI